MISKKIADPYDLVSEALNCDKNSLSPNSGLNKHPDWDSLGHLKIILAMERVYKVTIDDETIMDFTSMETILDFAHR